jgi:hypothetical protein
MRGMTYAAVVVHRKWVITKQPTLPAQQRWFARRVRNADEKRFIFLEKFYQQYQEIILILPKQKRHRHFL